MSVVRVNKTKDFTVMSNYHLRDKNLSLKAKGLLSQMLSLPEDWDYTIEGLAEINKENKTAIKTALDELREHRYLQVHKLMPNETKSGRYEYVYDIYEVPVSEKILNDIEQEVEKQGIEILGVEILPIENQAQINTNILNKDNKIQERKYTKKESAAKKNSQSGSMDEIISSCSFTEEVIQSIKDFIQYRSEIKKPITSIGLKKMVHKLEQLSQNPEEQIAIINQSIERNYMGIFPVKGNRFDNERSMISELNKLTVADINDYCKENGYKNVNATEFLGNYKKRNWMVGNTVVTDWHSAVDEWEAREQKKYQSQKDEEKIYHRSYMTRCLNAK